MNRNSTLGALAFILSGFTMQTVAQSEVSDQVKDFDTREALTFCNVSAFNQKDSLVAGGHCNRKQVSRYHPVESR